MASNVSVIFGQGRKQLVKTTPAMPLKNIVLAVCEKQKYPDVDSYGLKYGNVTLDLSLSVRFANLPAGAKLELVRLKATKVPTMVNVALQMDEGRLIQKFTTSTSYWDVLLAFEASSHRNLTRKTVKTGKSMSEVYLQPVCVYLNQEFGTIPVLKNTTLQSTGITSGNVLIRLIYRESEKSLEDVERENSSPISTSTTTASEPSPAQILNQPIPQTPTSVQDHAVETSPAVPLLRQQPAIHTETQAQLNLPQPERQHSNVLQNSLPSPVPNPQLRSSLTSNIPKNDNAAYQQPEVKGFAREVKVFRPSSDANMAAKIELPDSFYELTPAELKSILDSQRTKRSMKENAPMKTRQMRENEDLQRRRKYPRTLIRVRFPNRVQLQANFLSTEPISTLISFVRESLKNPKWDFYLYITPPIKKLTDQSQTFYDAGLTPASVVFFSFVNNIEEPEGYLKDELISCMENLPSAVEPQVFSEPMDVSHPEPVRSSSPLPREVHVPADYDPELREKQEGAKKSKVPKWFKLGNK